MIRIISLALPVIMFSILFIGCTDDRASKPIPSANWAKRVVNEVNKDSLQFGKSYLSIYSLIYSETEHRTHNLTVMVSLRNTSDKDTIYLENSHYFDTNGNLVRSYHEDIIYLAPMETIEIIIDELDISGGTGSNFIFDWYASKTCPEPIFEAVMNSTMARGISFTTTAKRIE